uniref:S100 calcium binding protein, beta (neural) n=1 Tax=Petromyzon marinus TaxID=7757 RepID=S4R9N2_PETMA
MSKLEQALLVIVDTFNRYSGKDADKTNLAKSELKELINIELSHFLEGVKDPQMLEMLMRDLDLNGDAECDFQEFMTMLTIIATACHSLVRERK